MFPHIFLEARNRAEWGVGQILSIDKHNKTATQQVQLSGLLFLEYLTVFALVCLETWYHFGII